MRWILRAALCLVGVVVVAFAALFGGVGPIAFLPGGMLWGQEREPPADWSFTDRIPEIQVQTHVRPLPWSVTTWVMSVDGNLFIAANNCDRVWTHHVLEDPKIRLRIDGALYEMQAHLEKDRAVGARVAPVVLAKYMGIGVDSASWVPGEQNGCVFRVEPRT